MLVIAAPAVVRIQRRGYPCQKSTNANRKVVIKNPSQGSMKPYAKTDTNTITSGVKDRGHGARAISCLCLSDIPNNTAEKIARRDKHTSGKKPGPTFLKLLPMG